MTYSQIKPVINILEKYAEEYRLDNAEEMADKILKEAIIGCGGKIHITAVYEFILNSIKYDIDALINNKRNNITICVTG